jgi:hypothetical protein
MVSLRGHSRCRRAVPSRPRQSKRNRGMLLRRQFHRHSRRRFCSLSIRPVHHSASLQRKACHQQNPHRRPESLICCHCSMILSLKSLRGRSLLSQGLHHTTQPRHNRPLLHLRQSHSRLLRDAMSMGILHLHSHLTVDPHMHPTAPCALLRLVGPST